MPVKFHFLIFYLKIIFLKKIKMESEKMGRGQNLVERYLRGLTRKTLFAGRSGVSFCMKKPGAPSTTASDVELDATFGGRSNNER